MTAKIHLTWEINCLCDFEGGGGEFCGLKFFQWNLLRTGPLELGKTPESIF